MTKENNQKNKKENLDKIQEEERDYWKKYADFMTGKYRDAYLNTPHYQDELKIFQEWINPQKGQKWLDLGCGALPITELILEKSKGEAKIWAGDIHLEPAKKRLEELGNPLINLEYIDLSKKLPFENNFFDGIVSSKVLNYIVKFENEKGKEALKLLFQEIYRILKPGGTFVWSFLYKENYLAGLVYGLPYLLNPYQWIKQKCFLPIFCVKMQKLFTPVFKKEKEGTYVCLSKKEWEELLISIGFRKLEWKESFGELILVNRVEKPL